MKADRLPTIRSRIVLLAIGCILPAALMVAGLIAYNHHQDRTALAQASMVTARAMMTAVDRDLAGVKAALLTLATSPHLTSDEISLFYGQAQEMLQIQQVNNVLLIAPTFQQRLNTLRPFGSELPSITNLALRQVFETGQPVVTDLYQGAVANKPIIAVGVPVYRGGKIIYVLAASILSQRLSRLLSEQRLDADWIGAILDSTGTILARSHQMERFVGTKATQAYVTRIAQVAEDHLEVTSVEGIRLLVVFSKSAVSKWTVAIGIPETLLIQDLWATLAWLVVGITLLLVGSIWWAWAIGGRITNSVCDLVGPALALGTGETIAVPGLHLRETNAVGRALTRASAMLAAAQHRASHDVLTGLANRALFDEILNHHLAICKRANSNLAVVYIDLDGFKPVNDLHGHATGDELLCLVGSRLETAIRESDLAARIGGDEFALLLVHAGLAAANTVARKVSDSLSAPYSIGALTLRISASVGIAVYPEAGTTREALSKHADEEMYKAKAMGKHPSASEVARHSTRHR